MANLRIRITCDRRFVRTLDNRHIPTCGAIAVGFPGRLHNARRYLIQLAVDTMPYKASEIFNMGLATQAIPDRDALMV